MRLVPPGPALFEGYLAALRRGWSPNNVRDVSAELLAEIEADRDGFLARISAPGVPASGFVKLPDGSRVPKLPSVSRWISDGEFCGVIGLRWQDGRDDLPEHVLGHIGYAVVPWKRRLGYATAALGLILDEARRVGLSWLEITTDPGNLASIRVIETNGGRFVEEFVNLRYGPDRRLRFAIDLQQPAPAAFYKLVLRE